MVATTSATTTTTIVVASSWVCPSSSLSILYFSLASNGCGLSLALFYSFLLVALCAISIHWMAFVIWPSVELKFMNTRIGSGFCGTDSMKALGFHGINYIRLWALFGFKPQTILLQVIASTMCRAWGIPKTFSYWALSTRSRIHLLQNLRQFNA